ncbi:MAG: YggS family pyridoxal phosphate-dependent enzyme [Saprospiraceae bacterium]
MSQVNKEIVNQIEKEATANRAKWIAVTKNQSPELISELYDMGLRSFGENRVQEMLEKQAILSKDIQWHQIGHLQRNKVKSIAPFVHLIHAVDSIELADEIEKQGKALNRRIKVLIQVHIAAEEEKFGIEAADLHAFIEMLKQRNYQFLEVKGLMGMATFTEDQNQVASEFALLHSCYEAIRNSDNFVAAQIDTLSMGMSGDYKIALQNGANLLRIGSILFK